MTLSAVPKTGFCDVGILDGKLVAPLAVSLSGPMLTDPAAEILSSRNRLKMRRVDTSPVAAQVVGFEPRRDRSFD